MTRLLAVITVWSTAALAQQYAISTYAGGGLPPMPTPAGTVGAPLGVATDRDGNVYFASGDLNCVFKLDPKGALTRVAGSFRPGYSGSFRGRRSGQLSQTAAV